MRVVLFGIMLMMNLYADVDKSSIEGVWEIPEEVEGQVSIGRIFIKGNRAYAYAFMYANKNGDELQLRDVDSEDSDAKDLKNMIFLANLKFDGECWVDGKIYRPSNGKLYSASACLSEDKNILSIRVSYESFRILGRTLQWNRLDSNKYKTDPSNAIMISEFINEE